MFNCSNAIIFVAYLAILCCIIALTWLYCFNQDDDGDSGWGCWCDRNTSGMITSERSVAGLYCMLLHSSLQAIVGSDFAVTQDGGQMK